MPGASQGVRHEPPALWWRDDDAGCDVTALEPLLEVAEHHRLPLALAVIPAILREPVTAAIAWTDVSVLQHGWNHTDHARPGEKKIELGGTIDRAVLDEQLKRGREILCAALPQRFLPVMVPPWNRIEQDVASRLSSLGYRGLSTAARQKPHVALELRQHDCHIDVIAWRKGRSFIGREAVLEKIAALLETSQSEAIGVLTHHAVMTAQDMEAVARVLVELRDEGMASVTSAQALFGCDA